MTKEILLPRPSGDDPDVRLLERLGFATVSDPYIEQVDAPDVDAVRARLLGELAKPGTALVVTSPRAVRSLRGDEPLHVFAEVHAYAVGPSTEVACRQLGINDVRTPDSDYSRAGLLAMMAQLAPSRAVLPISGAAPEDLVRGLTELGWEVISGVTYTVQTVVAEPASAAKLRAGSFAGVVVRSGSAARALAHFVAQWPQGTAVIAAGQSTARTLRSLGLPVSVVAADATPSTVVEALRSVLSAED